MRLISILVTPIVIRYKIMWNFLSKLSLIFVFFPMFLVRFLWRLLDIFDGKIGSILRYVLVCSRLGQCGKNVYFGSHIYIDDFSKLFIGSNVSIHHRCSILSGGEVWIGNEVSIAHGSSLISGNHTWINQDLSIRDNPVTLGSIKISDDVWIGCGVRVLSNVKIGSRCVIAAGAVVSKNLSSNSIYAGVPAKLIKSI